MALIHLRALGVTLSEPLFSDLDLTVAAGDRLGLVAANGRGKSTLLRCIAGAVEPTAGTVVRARGLRIAHVEQDVPPALHDLTVQAAVRRALPAEQAAAETWRVDVALDALEIPEPLRVRPLRALSGGWQRLAMLACAWVTDPGLLLLDEPNNHLDLARLARLEAFLNGLPRDVAVVLASHDRAFLDATTARTLFLRPQASETFPLPYGRAQAALAGIDAAQAREYQRDLKTAQQLRRQAAKLHNIGVNSGSDLLTVKTRQLRQRADRLEEAARPAHRERSAGTIRLAGRDTHAKVLVGFDDARVETPDGTLLFRTGRLTIGLGDRVVLLGRNGAGKSRLVSLVRQAVAEPGPATAAVRATPSLVLGHSDQALSELRAEETPHGLVCRRFEVGDQRARALLAGAGIAVDRQGRAIATLSGGQRARLAMLVLRLTRPSFYLLDEPTNHLDIEGQEALEAELKAQGATALLVSHDRSFVRAVGNRFWLIENRRLVEVESPEAFFAAEAAT
ncbi:ABC-F family ATP-binding cassette domain-containing protein [Labrys wisconsinensis]|uniref:ATPase subunit of ABC transporter with duplicated ATPase domains n=1 Tax=Labrys wisconsinensis TaxID=425677 RepID=A0ABU0JMN5_9HYPH|nr:ABC-F family ATP-binding cassette domain-containing protein [Labrys wisconsinensis]MDQ0474554.1 ATPase subunit of ABC transporter with duplicated ATPase domains [Labrys wisconsinensis]